MSEHSADVDASQFLVYGPWANDDSACFVVTCKWCGTEIIDSSDEVSIADLLARASLHICYAAPARPAHDFANHLPGDEPDCPGCVTSGGTP